jgi:murein DD-endopeptidase MepM/ murein hydrolase activator NlpD
MVLGTSGRDSVTALAESEPHTPVQMAPGPTASLTESTLVEEYGNYEGDIGSFTPHVPAQPAWRSSVPLAKPVSGVVTQTFYPAGGHFGIDYATSAGTPVFSSADGFVIFSGWTYDDGNMIMISHAAGFMTVYKHNQSLLKPQNASVREGDVIALVGSSGRTSKGPHLHFEVWKDGLPVDPDAYLLVHSRMPTMF